MKRLISLLLILAAATAFGQNIRTVKGVYTFYGERSHSPEDCRRLALENARIQALANEFGTMVTQDTYSNTNVTADGRETSFFSQLNSMEVKGEWIADEGEPEYESRLDADGNYVVTCKVVGKARAISNETVDFTAAVLKNGTELKFADTRFRSGDGMYLYFMAPVDGYVAVFLVAERNNVYCLLPYMGNADGQMKVRRNREYVFFDGSKSYDGAGEVDELVMTVDGDLERDQLYVVFSPNPFAKTVDHDSGEGLPRSLSIEEFRKWLVNSRRKDMKMNVKIMNLVINNV